MQCIVWILDIVVWDWKKKEVKVKREKEVEREEEDRREREREGKNGEKVGRKGWKKKDRLVFTFDNCCCESFERRQGGTFSRLFEGWNEADGRSN